jgi:hypothetical protein
MPFLNGDEGVRIASARDQLLVAVEAGERHLPGVEAGLLVGKEPKAEKESIPGWEVELKEIGMIRGDRQVAMKNPRGEEELME